MATVSYCDDVGDVGSIGSPAAGDFAIICDKSTDVFTMQRYTTSWAQVAIGGDVSPSDLKVSVYGLKFSNTTNGGDATSGAWRIYPLNIEVYDGINCAFTSNNFALPAGVYEVYGHFQFSYVLQERVYLYDVTNSKKIENVWSLSCQDNQNSNINYTVVLAGRFALSDSIGCAVYYKVNTTNAGDGLGVKTNNGTVDNYFGILFVRQIEAYT